MSTDRRTFLKGTAIKAAGLASIPAILSATMPTGSSKRKPKFSMLENNNVVLFQGDSITDAGRDKSREMPNDLRSFGTGYAFLASAELLKEFPEKQLQIYNRGISGNKVYQLIDRWQKDCISITPSVLSILIGVNDFWHTLNGSYNGTVEKYEADFRTLLRLTVRLLPEVKLVVGEPFIVNGGSAITDEWYPAFDSYRAAAHKISTESGAIFIPYQKIFNEALQYAPGPYWAPDGVHPSMAGCSLMAQAWLKAIE